MDESENAAGGLLASARRIVRSVCDLAQSRLELFLLEIKEERLRLVQVLMLVAVCVVCTLMTLLLVTFTVVVIFWEQRGLVLGLLTALYAIVAGGTMWSLRRRFREWQPFASTLDQFKKDRECLGRQN